MKILSPSQMRNLEREAEHLGLSPSFLMDRAARSALQVIRENYSILNKKILIICGKGNNGGDGLALARLLAPQAAVCLALGEPGPGSPGAFHLARCRESGVPVYGTDWLMDQRSGDYGLVVDALLGTGLSRPVTGTASRVIDKINRFGRPVVSLDIPSGVNGLNGRLEGSTVRADRTVTFGLPKGGNLLFPGSEWGGELILSYLEIPSELRARTSSLFRINEPSSLPERPQNSHKASWGKLLVTAGSAFYGGAPLFVSASFLKSGGGYVNLAVPEQLSLPMMIGLPEAVLHPLSGDGGPFLGLNHLDEIKSLASGKAALVTGPGMGLRGETGDLVRALVSDLSLPVIVDGDGITHLAGHEYLTRGKNIFLTPHPGEAARLLNTSTAEVEHDRPAAVREIADRYGATVVLKGAHSLVTAPGEDIRMNLSGDSSLATAGSGDILGGILGAMLGMGLNGADAMGTAVFVHGLAGEEAGRRLGRDGVMATDILEALPAAVWEYREHYDEYRNGLNRRIGLVR